MDRVDLGEVMLSEEVTPRVARWPVKSPVLVTLLFALLALIGCAGGERGEQAAQPPCDLALTRATVVRVIDGDTAVLRLDSGTVEKTRFIGIDTPESTNRIEPYGDQAAAYTAQTLRQGRVVYLERDVETRDRYGRMLAYVWLEPPADTGLSEVRTKMLNARLAAEGYAQQLTVPPNVKYERHFRELVARARSSRLGLWGESERDSAP